MFYRATDAFKAWVKSSKTRQAASPNHSKHPALYLIGFNINSWHHCSPAAPTAVNIPPECPPDSLALGYATWTFLHTTAAYYPTNPNPQQRRHMLNLLSSLPTLYPCSYCAQHLGGEMKRNPPDVTSRDTLSKWLCGVHNEVNLRLGKEPFDCAKVDERWKDGPANGSCD
jgi:FAD-linked sulfhydryl oxidase